MVFSLMMGVDDEIVPLIGEETNKVSSVMEGVDEEITATIQNKCHLEGSSQTC
jgi:hypothetical protein